ncbi:virulence factor TspB C-terminal domain-related protein [Chromobacterium phragmitis]|uniref:virulence factor TspB C-terminal domain-related protein n=1 Tax=Chromobacterium phragmitis TaxID=2202141 RepID=UPI0011AE6EBA|nr:virulence factor TspB C-terminal domain-related protein [Chromobacterium phragmitis]
MWRAISLFWRFWVLVGFCCAPANSFADYEAIKTYFMRGQSFSSLDSAISYCTSLPADQNASWGGSGCIIGGINFPYSISYSCGAADGPPTWNGWCISKSTTPPGSNTNPPACPPPDVMQITCQSMAGKHQKSGMITPTSGPGCDTGGGSPGMGLCGAGCEMTTRTVVTPTASYMDHVYTGNYCKPNGTVGNPGDYIKNPPKNQVCGNNQTYGEINGVPTCVDNAQKPGTQPPETTSPDSCPRGSVALISPTTGKPIGCVDPKDPSKPCGDGQYSVTVNGTTICMGTPDKPTPTSPAGTGSSSGHAGGPSNSGGVPGGKPGSGTGTKPGDGSTPGDGTKPGDSSSPQPETCDDKFPSGLKWVCGLGAGLSGPDGSDKLTTQQGGDIGGMLDESDMFGGGSCPATRSVAVPVGDMTWNWDIDFSPFCRFVLLLRPGVIAVAMLTALFIIFKRG